MIMQLQQSIVLQKCSHGSVVSSLPKFYRCAAMVLQYHHSIVLQKCSHGFVVPSLNCYTGVQLWFCSTITPSFYRSAAMVLKYHHSIVLQECSYGSVVPSLHCSTEVQPWFCSSSTPWLHVPGQGLEGPSTRGWRLEGPDERCTRLWGGWRTLILRSTSAGTVPLYTCTYTNVKKTRRGRPR